MLQGLVILALLCNVIAAGTKDIDILASPLNGGELERLGTVALDTSTLEATYYKVQDATSTGVRCVGTKNKSGEFSCMNVATIASNTVAEITLYLDIDEEVANLAYVEHLTANTNGDSYEKVSSVEIIVSPHEGPKPELKEPVKLVNGQVQQPEQEKSFIQKYWIYIVPALLMMMVSGGGQQ